MVSAAVLKQFLKARLSALGLVLVLCMGMVGNAFVQADGKFLNVRGASTTLEDGVYLLSANIDYRLSAAALEALQNGVPLTIELEIQVLEAPWLMVWEKEVANLRERYSIQYHALSEQYLVENLNTGVQRNFPTRDAALEALGTVVDLPMLDKNLLAPGKRYVGRMRARLDIEALPLPLRPLAYLSSQWRLQSAWYQWPIHS
jgi:hypothetical protein